MENLTCEIPCPGRLQGWEFEVSYRLLGCGCIQEMVEIEIPATPRKRIEVRYWSGICPDCFVADRHNFSRQPQAKWLQT